MKAVILAGGLGSRISEESYLKPKPMVEIGGKPILWHIMKIYHHYGIDEFIICLGYKGYLIKEYFVNYFLHNANITVDGRTGSIKFHDSTSEHWSVTLVDTGDETMTGGRLKRVASFLEPDEPFCLTYGDGVADVNIHELVAFHRKHGLKASLTAVMPPGRFGALSLDDHTVTKFIEKPHGGLGQINGGFFILDPSVIQYIKDDSTAWEDEPLARLAAEGQLQAYFHSGFWQPMDTLRDKKSLEALWATGNAPWHIWK